MEEILRIVMEAVAISVGLLLLILIRKLAKKYGFELKEAEEDSLLAVMTRIVLHVEEEGAKLLKANGKRTKGRDKLREALTLFSEELPGHTKGKAMQLAHEALFVNGIGAAASISEVRYEAAKKPLTGANSTIKTGTDEDGGGPDYPRPDNAGAL